MRLTRAFCQLVHVCGSVSFSDRLLVWISVFVQQLFMYALEMCDSSCRLSNFLWFESYLPSVCRAFTDVISSHPAENAGWAMHFLSAQYSPNVFSWLNRACLLSQLIHIFISLLVPYWSRVLFHRNNRVVFELLVVQFELCSLVC